MVVAIEGVETVLAVVVASVGADELVVVSVGADGLVVLDDELDPPHAASASEIATAAQQPTIRMQGV